MIKLPKNAYRVWYRGEESKEILQEYLDFLLAKEYGFITNDDWDRNFPPLSYEFHEASVISNIVLEIDDLSVLENIKKSVENLGIKHLVIFTNSILEKNDFLKIESVFIESSLSGIEIFSPHHSLVDKGFIQELQSETARIYNLIFYNCKKAPFKVKDEFKFVVSFVKENIKMTSCGKVDLIYFNTNLPKVLESINHNSCLHKKIAIDIDGNIKNCPVMPQSFGNINDTTLEEALGHQDFKKYWNLTKDEVEVCKDCEFRYICTDCRAYKEDPENDYSKPLKCGYDPYKGEWEEWSKNPLKEKTIKHYKLNETI